MVAGVVERRHGGGSWRIYGCRWRWWCGGEGPTDLGPSWQNLTTCRALAAEELRVAGEGGGGSEGGGKEGLQGDAAKMDKGVGMPVIKYWGTNYCHQL